MLTEPIAEVDFDSVLGRLTPTESLAYAIVVLAEPLRITRWVELVTNMGARETPTRAFSTTSLRTAVDGLFRSGLVVSTSDGHFWCLPGTLPLALRWVAGRADAARLAGVCGPATYEVSHDLRRALVARLDADAALGRLAASSPDRAAKVALELAFPFLPDWLASFTPRFHDLVVELALVGLERGHATSLGPYLPLTRRADLRARLSARALAALAGVALQRGDVEVVRAIAEGDAPAELRSTLLAALALVEGHGAEAARLARALPPPRRDDHAGTAFLLATFALWVDDPSSDALRKRLDHGGRKHAPLQQTFRVFAAMAAGGFEPVRWASQVAEDRLTSLFIALFARDRLDHYTQGRAVMRAVESETVVGGDGFRWVAAQLAHAAWEQYQLLPERGRQIAGTPPTPPPPTPLVLFTATSTRAAWELPLERLEKAAEALAAPPAAPEESGEERIVWRVLHMSLALEPYLQKRSASGRWTAGRKLALKHLLPDGSALASLPEEDRRVARHVREDRRTIHGYPSVEHRVLPRAWLDLVGHPRVHLEGADEPIPVVRGTLRLRLDHDDGEAVLRAEPPDLRAGVNPRLEGDRIVVYEVDDATAKLLDDLRAPLRIPREGAARLAAVVDRLATRIPVESATPTGARSVSPDPRPTIRLTPGRGGLTVSLLVRPLGPTGPLITPGAGAPTLIGQLGGEPVQTARDLEAEAARASAVIEACTMLDGREIGDHQWFVDDPEACLELVGALDRLGDEVTVEWPHGAPLRLRARVGRPALRGKLARAGGAFSLEASLAVDGQLSLELESLLELLAVHPGRFVQLASGDYLELEQDLRDVLDGLRTARNEAPGVRGRVELPAAALSVLDALTAPGGALALDAASSSWRQRVDDVFRKAPRVPRGFQGDLRDYQIEGFRWLARLADLGLGACLADDMGLGKTVQLAALLLHRASGGPALVVAPTSVCDNWRRELARFAPTLGVRMVLSGADRERALTDLGRRDVVVTSYAILQQESAAFHEVAWSTAILDEAQLIKNAETLRAQAAFGLRAEARIAATGTPVENHAGDLFSLFQFLNPGLLGTARSFAAAMAAGGTTARARRRLLQPFVLRRTKAQVLDDLPALTEVERAVTLTAGEAKLYESIRKAALAKLGTGGASGKARIAVLAELTRLRRLCCHPGLVAPEANLGSSKLESFIELVEELVEGRHRALVFSQFTDVLALVRPLLDARGIAYQHLDGSTPPKQRAAAVEAFQGGEGDVFLISLKAGGFGLNLTGADYVVHLDPWWNPAVEAQASDRAHRIGQTRPVTVYRLVTRGTIEERIVELHREKKDLAADLLEGTGKAASMTADELRGLLDAR